MNTSIRAMAMPIVALAMLVLVAGCAQTIPCQSNLRLDLPAGQKQTGKLTIRMADELRPLVVTVKPVKMPLTTSYKFQIGKTLEGNLTNTLGGLFQTVQVSTQAIEDIRSAPFVLEPELLDHRIKIGASIFSSHKAHLAIRYSFYRSGKKVFTLETQTDGTSAMESSEIVGHVVVSLASAGGGARGYRQSIGRAYDQALAKSIDELAAKLLAILPKR